MPDLTTLLSKFLTALYGGTLYSNPFGATSVGLPVIQAVGRATAQVAANANVLTYTVGASDGSFEYAVVVTLTTAGSANFVVTATFTDESNTVRANVVDLQNGASLVASVTSAGQYCGTVRQIRAKAGTTIVIATTGTFTSAVYNVEALIKQVA